LRKQSIISDKHFEHCAKGKGLPRFAADPYKSLAITFISKMHILLKTFGIIREDIHPTVNLYSGIQ